MLIVTGGQQAQRGELKDLLDPAPTIHNDSFVKNTVAV